MALGTSAPELFVNLLAAARGNTSFAMSNVSGSNLANFCVGFGICTLTSGILIRRREFGTDLVLVCLAPLVVMAMFFFTDNRSLPIITIVPLTILLIYYVRSLRGRSSATAEEHPKDVNATIGVLFFLVGVAALYGGGEFVLRSALTTARAWGVTEDVIGLTVVAIGTSVPDVTASIVAARRHEFGIAAGNLLGSNISNLVLVLNGTLLFSQQALPTTMAVRLDYAAVAIVSVFCCTCAARADMIPRWGGAALILGYVGYLAGRLLLLA